MHVVIFTSVEDHDAIAICAIPSSQSDGRRAAFQQAHREFIAGGFHRGAFLLRGLIDDLRRDFAPVIALCQHAGDPALALHHAGMFGSIEKCQEHIDAVEESAGDVDRAARIIEALLAGSDLPGDAEPSDVMLLLRNVCFRHHVDMPVKVVVQHVDGTDYSGDITTTGPVA